MNKTIALAALGFGVTMAIIIGQKLSEQAMAVIVGAVIGVAASVPMTALVLWLTQRHAAQGPAMTRGFASPAEVRPQVYVVQTPAPPAPAQPLAQMGYLSAPALMPYAAHAERQFTIIGWEEEADEDLVRRNG